MEMVLIMQLHLFLVGWVSGLLPQRIQKIHTQMPEMQLCHWCDRASLHQTREMHHRNYDWNRHYPHRPGHNILRSLGLPKLQILFC